MRKIYMVGLAVMIAGAANGQSSPAGPERQSGNWGRGRLFISPMGEPFRSEKGGTDPVDLWFQQADNNHDGALSREEFEKDEARWFSVLDRGHDGEIDPDDIEYYETVLAPEIRVGGGSGGSRSGMRGGGGRGGGGGHRGGGMGGGGGHRGGGSRGGDGDDGDVQGGGETHVTKGKRGAARYSWFDFPEPITVADTHFNRGIDPREFLKAADDRFDMLVGGHDGLIHRGDLPKISEAPAGMRGRGGGSGGGGRRPIPPDQRSGGEDSEPTDLSNASR